MGLIDLKSDMILKYSFIYFNSFGLDYKQEITSPGYKSDN